MALAKTGNPLVDISGSAGGSIFTRDSSGLHMISPGRHVRKRSALQDRRRRAFLTAIHAWHLASSLGYAIIWKLYAEHHPHTNRMGATVTLSGYMFFMKFNIYRAYNYVPCILLPPEG